MAYAYNYKAQPDAAIIFYKKAQNIFETIKNNEALGFTDIAIAKIYIGRYQLDSALLHLQKADALSNALSNQTMQADVQWSMGLIYKNKEDYLTAARFFNIAMNTFLKQQNFQKYILAGCHLSMAYRLSDLNDSSLYILSQCKSVFNKRALLDSLLYATILENYADTYLEMDNNPRALTHFIAALTLFEKYHRIVDIAYEKYSIGRTLTKMNRFKEAEKYLLQSYHIYDSLKNYKQLVWVSNVLNQMYVKLEDWHSAYAYLQKKAAWIDTIGIHDQIEKATALNKKFETEKKEKEISLLKSKNQMTLWIFIAALLALILAGLIIWLRYTRTKMHEEKILNYFATSLYNQNTIEDVFWDIAKNCISQLNFEDCVIYEYDEVRKVLIQKAAFGPKNPEGHIISNMIVIPMGKGIVGHVAQSLQPEIIKDTRKDERYIVDDLSRNSEIAVPVLVDGKLLGIIDSEHHRAGFFTKRHLTILQKIADICSKKVTRYFVEEGLRKKIARDLHDDMGSTLSSINIISKVALQQQSAEGHLKTQLASIKDYSSSIMESMNDMVWAINPLHDNMESLLVKMKEWAAEICEPRQIELNFNVNESTELVKLDAAKRKHIFLIFKEAVNNAIKYSNCDRITVIFFHDDTGKKLALSITDDGDGFDTRHYKAGNGIQNMQARAGLLQGNVQIDSSVNGGTCIHLTCYL